MAWYDDVAGFFSGAAKTVGDAANWVGEGVSNGWSNLAESWDKWDSPVMPIAGSLANIGNTALFGIPEHIAEAWVESDQKKYEETGKKSYMLNAAETAVDAMTDGKSDNDLGSFGKYIGKGFVGAAGKGVSAVKDGVGEVAKAASEDTTVGNVMSGAKGLWLSFKMSKFGSYAIAAAKMIGNKIGCMINPSGYTPWKDLGITLTSTADKIRKDAEKAFVDNGGELKKADNSNNSEKKNADASDKDNDKQAQKQKERVAQAESIAPNTGSKDSSELAMA